MPIKSIRRISMEIRQYYQQFVTPKIVSNHKIYLIDDDREVISVSIVPNGGTIIQYYRVRFVDEAELVISKSHGVVIDIYPGIVHNR